MTTATKQIETAAERYRRIKEERLAKVELFDFESPSGMVWKLRRPELAQFITSGTMPMELAAKLAPEAEKAGGDMAAAFNALSIEEKVQMVAFSAKVVQFCAVEPRIVEHPKGPNEIARDEMELDDFNAIFAWAMPGGDGADSLDNFRSE